MLSCLVAYQPTYHPQGGASTLRTVGSWSTSDYRRTPYRYSNYPVLLTPVDKEASKVKAWRRKVMNRNSFSQNATVLSAPNTRHPGWLSGILSDREPLWASRPYCVRLQLPLSQFFVHFVTEKFRIYFYLSNCQSGPLAQCAPSYFSFWIKSTLSCYAISFGLTNSCDLNH